jgi:quinol monooxygenase YgiN
LIADPNPEDMLMRYIQNSPSGRTEAGGWMPATAGCLVIAATALITATILAGTPARAQSDSEAVYAVTYLDVSTNWVLQGGGLLKQYREASRKEAGNLEFTVLQETDRPNRFAIVEGWKDQAAFTAHTKSADASRFAFVLEAIRNSPPDRHMLHTFATAPARGTAPSGALYMVEHVDFMGGDPKIGLAAQPLVKDLAATTQKEEGALRYDVYQQPAPRVNHYEVVSVWKDPKAFDAHETAAYTRQFRATTVMTGMPARANLYDQRFYKVLD